MPHSIPTPSARWCWWNPTIVTRRTKFEAHLTREQIAADRAEVKANDAGKAVFASLDQAQDAGPLPAVPLVVITATSSDGWPPGCDPQLFDQLRAEPQADLATRVPGGQQVSANGSGHEVPHDRPEICSSNALNRRAPS